jgi:hypothetical protein
MAAARCDRKRETTKDRGMGKIFLIGLAFGVAALLGMAVFVIQL